MSVTTRLHADGRNITVERVQDVEDILELNKVRQNEPQSRSSDFRHIASVPNIFLERWLNEEHARGNTMLRLWTPEFDKLVEQKLKDPDWRFLRTDNPSNPFHVGWR